MNSSNSSDVTAHLLLFSETDWDRGLPRDEVEAIMAKLDAWFADLYAQGKVLSAEPLHAGGKRISGAEGVVDGPFPESKEAIGGYLLLGVVDPEEALEIARRNPLLPYGLVIELRTVARECPTLTRVSKRLAAAG